MSSCATYHAPPRTPLTEIYLVQKYGMSNSSSILSTFKEEEQEQINAQLKREKHNNRSTWWNLPLGLIMQLVYEVRHDLKKKNLLFIVVLFFCDENLLHRRNLKENLDWHWMVPPCGILLS